MAIVAVIPSAVTTVDTRDGNHYEIFTVFHNGSQDTAINVSDGCVSCALMPDNQTSSVPATQTTTESTGIALLNQTSGTSGLSFGDWATSDGVKQVMIDGNVAAGTYVVIARFTGSGAGSGSGAKTLDF